MKVIVSQKEKSRDQSTFLLISLHPDRTPRAPDAATGLADPPGFALAVSYPTRARANLAHRDRCTGSLRVDGGLRGLGCRVCCVAPILLVLVDVIGQGDCSRVADRAVAW